MDNIDDGYGLSAEKNTKHIPAPNIEYLPQKPKKYNPNIGLIGTGGISDYHLKNYKTLGLKVVALSDKFPEKATSLRDKYYPNASVYEDYMEILNRDDIDVVDITPHPVDRLPILKKAIVAKKHILSQKPFVLEISEGEELVKMAKHAGIKLAVNQNGRWAPHFSYMRNAVKKGLIGRPLSVDFSLQWDQTWIKGLEGFEGIKHMVLYDFAIHWFDITCCIMEGQQPVSVHASAIKYDEQVYRPAALASCIINYDQAQVRMAFNAHTRLGEEDVTTIVGTHGTIRSRGIGFNQMEEIEIYTQEGQVKVPLEGCWFDNGFQGTMGELLCAIEEGREPYNSAANNLLSLRLCYAALKSADSGKLVKILER